MPQYDFDLITIGAGSGGVRASRIAASYGARVAVVEERYLGGTCVNVGCIPKKLLVYASEYGPALEEAPGFGWNIAPGRFDWARLIANKNREIQRLNGVYGEVLTSAGAAIIDGRATLLDAHTVAVGNRRISAEYVLIATGSWPVVPAIPGAEHAITSNEAFFLKELPPSVILVGGGYIASEFAGIFHGMGVKVSQLYRGELFMRGFDDDLRAFLGEQMRKRGIDLRFNTDVTKIELMGDGVRATLTDGTVLDAGLIMYATGRAPNTHNMGLEHAGVELDAAGAVVVDSFSRSSQRNIYAVGDCTNRAMLTPVAIAEGQAMAETVFNHKPTAVDYALVPTAVFSQPSLGTVGLTEAEARRRLGEIDVYKSNFRPLRHTISGREERTLMKLVVERKTDRVVGCHMIGADAGEIIQGFAVALKCNATKADFDATIAIHPTAAEELVTMRKKAE
ncbi:MAG TPA: glutathione-disulfide reductase [Candidatus Binataceae bacterium]|nr:glutathione-disulfide reductase [Candidatus Binataceae bacterium]